MLRLGICLLAWFTLATLDANRVKAAENDPLHKRIDQAIGFGTEEFEKIAAEEADDAEFVRRVYLDLTGVIPSGDAAREFVADTSPEKRPVLIDRLLDSPQFARHMQYTFDTMLMERRPDKHIKGEWREYLRTSFAQNKPWNQLVTEILTSDGADDDTRAAAKFFLDREMKTDAMTRDLGRIFLGRDLQCAQCHDHPQVDEYKQRHYHGLAAFLNRSFLFTDPKSKKASIGEKADGTVKFTSVFTSESDEAAPQLLDLSPINDPPLAKEPYKVKPDKKARAIPVYSRRLQLAAAMTSDENLAFRQNIANRLWALVMGRGIVEPVDMWHEGNPPSHPELLDLLADELLKRDYDLKFLLRELALSKTYQRSSQYQTGANDVRDDQFAVALLKPLTPEQLAWSMMQATRLTDVTLVKLKAKHLEAGMENAAAEVEDPAWQEAALHDALKSNVDAFVSLFGVAGIQTSQFDGSANQALFLRNGKLLNGWIQTNDSQLVGRLSKMETSQLIDEVYFSIFSRPPTAEENKETRDYLDANNQDREAAISRLVWAALSSAEFRFNH